MATCRTGRGGSYSHAYMLETSYLDMGDVKQPRCHHDDTAVTAGDGAVTVR